ncbi:MAG TPA: toll/interleukin-1 receptor domain-containing protein, partial [Acidimicrobiales bacterium]|nr:toll/interleukin-1 receptor domain-containing protein [Acidimicrobiales bacterium]
MGGIFISYRRDDTAPYARLLSGALASRFGAHRVFRDIDTLTPGTDFPRAIADAVEGCDVLLALIGPGWLTAERDGRRRLDDPGDFVRLEIAAALERGTLVVPVLMERTPMPAGDELPAPIAALADRNALRLADESWGDGVRRLLEALERLVPPSEAPAPASPPGAAPGGDHITAHIAGSVPGQVAVGTGIVQTQSPPG